MTRNNLDIPKSSIDSIVEKGGIDIIFHSAATVDFTERIDIAVDINILGLLRLLEMAKEISGTKSLFKSAPPTLVAINGAVPQFTKIYPLDFDPYKLINSVQGEKSEIELSKLPIEL